MEINRENISSWLLRLEEGKLSPAENDALDAFLMLHPELIPMDDETFSLSAVNTEETYPGRHRLHREIPGADTVVERDNFELLAIARYEGDLSPEQEAGFERLCSGDEELSRLRQEISLSRLGAVEIAYPYKKKLKHIERRGLRPAWLISLSAAAALALLFTLLKKDPVTEAPGPGSQELAKQELFEESIPVPEVIPEPGVIPKPEATVPAAAAGKGIIRQAELPELTDADPPEAYIEELVCQGPLRMAQANITASSLGYTAPADRIRSLELPPGQAAHQQDAWQNSRAFLDRHNISVSTLASAGVEQINRMTGSEISLGFSRNDEGRISGFRFRSENFKVDAPIGNSD